MGEPIILVRADDPERKPQLYACPKCGACNSPRIYACRDDEAHRAAREAAANCYACRENNVCACGEPCEKHWTACAKCRRAKKIAAAEQVAASGLDYCFGLDGGEFYHSPEEAAEAGEEWVHAAAFRPFSIDIDRLFDNIVDDHHEDASADDLIDTAPLTAACEAFNKAQTGGTYDCDYKRIANVSHLAGNTGKAVAS